MQTTKGVEFRWDIYREAIPQIALFHLSLYSRRLTADQGHMDAMYVLALEEVL